MKQGRQLFITMVMLFTVLLLTDNLKAGTHTESQDVFSLFPATNATRVNPDTRLVLTFADPVILGNKGKVRVYDAATDEAVDSLDMSIAPGPRNTRTPAPYDTMSFPGIPDKVYTVYDPDTDPTHVYQLNYIGGTSETDACHFFPILIHGNTATICLHNNHLEYNKTYYVTIDPEVFPFTDGRFQGISGKTGWTFITKEAPPVADAESLVVAADGSGDFSTLQGAFDFIPLNNTIPRTIFIKNGKYEEMVILKNKHNVTIIGEDRENTIIRYANNGVFNIRRYEFTVAYSNDIQLVNFTTETMGVAPAQAEGLLVKGDRIQVHNVTVLGSGDAVQAGGTIYMSESSIRGFGDNVLGYGIYFNRCDFISTYGPHLWARNGEGKPGYTLYKCNLWGEAGVHGAPYDQLNVTYARAPIVSNYSYPYTEAVLLECAVADLNPEGFGQTSFACEEAHCWEYNTVNLSDGSPADYSKRAAYSKQLTMEEDAEIIERYSDPTAVLEWTPEYAPVLFSKDDTIQVEERSRFEIVARYAVAPSADFQWYKDGVALEGQTEPRIMLDSVKMSDAGVYSLSIKNSLGYDSTRIHTLFVEEYDPGVSSVAQGIDPPGLKVYPNPANEILHIEYLENMEGRVRISIFDIAGKEVGSFEEYAANTGSKSTLNVSGLSAGLYFIQVENRNVLYAHKVRKVI